MRNIFSRSNREVLEQFACSNVLLAFDYDGTLAPIVSKPERAVMREATRSLLEEVAKSYPCIVISGRAQRDVMRRLHGVGIHEVIGNHGMEPRHATSELADVVARWHPHLQAHLAGLPGVEIEDKVFSVAVHYRRSREKKLVRATILNAASALGDVHLIGGKQVVNLLPKGAPHKGMALVRERARLGCDTAIFVGDDDTDEEVFGLDEPGRLLSIRVGQRRSSAAAYFIESQRVIDRLLQLLLRLRKEAGIARSPWRGR